MSGGWIERGRRGGPGRGEEAELAGEPSLSRPERGSVRGVLASWVFVVTDCCGAPLKTIYLGLFLRPIRPRTAVQRQWYGSAVQGPGCLKC